MWHRIAKRKRRAQRRWDRHGQAGNDETTASRAVSVGAAAAIGACRIVCGAAGSRSGYQLLYGGRFAGMLDRRSGLLGSGIGRNRGVPGMHMTGVRLRSRGRKCKGGQSGSQAQDVHDLPSEGHGITF